MNALMVVENNLPIEQIRVVEKEIEAQSLTEARRGIKDWLDARELIEDLRLMEEEYGTIRRPEGLAKWLLQCYAMICLAIHNAYKYLAGMNRS